MKKIRFLPQTQKDSEWLKLNKYYGSILPDYMKTPETHAGELVYCKIDTLKALMKNKIYKIKTIIKASGYGAYQIKLEGVPGRFSWRNFDFIENNVALYRDYQINQVMDIDTEFSTKIIGRKIDTIKHKEIALVQMIGHILNAQIGMIGDIPNELDYSSFMSIILKKYKKYGINETDFNELMNAPLKDIFKYFELNI